MKIVTRWEIDLFANYGGENPYKFVNAQTAAVMEIARRLEMDITVNEVRKMISAEADHPDSNPLLATQGPDRGKMYIWEDETIRPGDKVIPAVIKMVRGIPTYATCAVGGTITADDVLSITITDAGLSGGEQTASYTVQAEDTLASIVVGLKNAINEIEGIEDAGIWSMAYITEVYTNVMISCNAGTTFAADTSEGATETLVFI